MVRDSYLIIKHEVSRLKLLRVKNVLGLENENRSIGVPSFLRSQKDESL